MMSSKDDLKQTLANLSSTSSRHIYNALVHIRTKVIKSQNALKKILANGLVPKLLKILDNADTSEAKPKNADVALSILGNLCMEPETRNNVIACSGVESLARHLLESSVESIQNRSCRGLANLALTLTAVPQILNLEVAPRLMKLLQETKSKECQLTYCRAYRLLGRNRDGQKKVVEAGAVLSIAKLLKHDDPEVMKCALRTVSELIQLGCCSSFARQIIGANILDKLIALVESEDLTDSHSALSTIFSLVNQPDARAAIGSAGGIQFFIHLLKQEKDVKNISQISIINALCLCGKEAVNRIKIRELGGLEVFLDALRDSKFSHVHDRIISGFVCFLYDDASIDVLLENKLVEILLVHLQRCGDFKSSIEDLTFRKEYNAEDVNVCESFTDYSKKSSTSGTRPSHSPSKGPSNKNLIISKSLEECEDYRKDSKSFRPNSLTKLKRSMSECATSEGQSCSYPNDTDHKRTPSETFQGENETSKPFQEEPPNRLHMFSIDSPTYEINTEWNLEKFSSQTCKQTFNNQGDLRTPSPGPPLSPMSNDTYYSPAQSSPTYSLPRSPESAPGSPSVSGLDTEYHPVLSVPYNCSSDTSPLEWSAEESSSGTKVSNLCYSSSEDDTCESERKEDRVPVSESCYDKSGSLTDVEPSEKNPQTKATSAVTEVSQTSEADMESGKITRYGKRSLSLRSPSYQLVESCPKRKKTDSKRSDIMKTTEHNILILLSRISVKTDPSMYLVTQPVISCMLDYLFYVPRPHSRCVRTLSRLFKNPHCLETCLLLSVPVSIYQKIILDSEGIDNESYGNFSQRGSSHSRRSSRLSTSSEDSFCGGPLTSLDNSFPGSSTCSKDNALDFTHGLLASPTSPRSEADISFKVGQSPMSQNVAELCVVEVGQSGLSLLKDLSFSAETLYGRGIISRILQRRSRDEKLMCTVSLLFLCWGSVMQKQYLIRFRILDTVLDLLKEELTEPGPVFMAIVAGLTFICKLNSIPLKLKKERTDVIFKPITQSDNGSSDNCVYGNLEADVSFNVDCKIIGANREKLVQSSAMFLAMLEGHYSESSQSEIRIRDTTHDALEYVLHYLQGCALDCPVLKKAEPNSNGISVDFVLDVLALADRFLLVDLAHYLKLTITSHHLNSESCAAVFEFASFHEFSALASDCVKVILCSPISLSEKSHILAQMMSGECAELFVEMLKTVLREGTE